MKLEIDEKTKVMCEHHNSPTDIELDATYDISDNVIIIKPCPKCLDEEAEDMARK